MDPFLPEKSEDVERIKQMETDIHQVFIDWVKERRAGKFTRPDDELFTGEFWSAFRGQGLGLIDSLGDMHGVLRERYGEKVRLKLIEPKRPLFQLPRVGFGGAVGTGLASDVVAAIEDRAIWSRLGL